MFASPITAAKPLITSVLRDELKGARYQTDQVSELSKRIGDGIVAKLTTEVVGLERYKLIANVSIFQNEGQGARMDTRAVWDPDADGVLQETFVNDSIKCVAVVFAICSQ